MQVHAMLLAWTAPTCIDTGPDDGLLQLALVVFFLVALVHLLMCIDMITGGHILQLALQLRMW